MKNAIIIHGTGGNPSVFWIPWLAAELKKSGYKVSTPQIPNSENPVLSEALSFVLDNYEINEDTVLIGHSSGATLILSILESIDVKVKKAILVAGFCRQLGDEKAPILQYSYDWSKIKSHSDELYFINSDNDPWGCDDSMGREMQQHTGGKLIVMHDGHMGSDKYDQPYKEFPLLLKLIEEVDSNNEAIKNDI